MNACFLLHLLVVFHHHIFLLLNFMKKLESRIIRTFHLAFIKKKDSRNISCVRYIKGFTCSQVSENLVRNINTNMTCYAKVQILKKNLTLKSSQDGDTRGKFGYRYHTFQFAARRLSRSLELKEIGLGPTGPAARIRGYCAGVKQTSVFPLCFTLAMRGVHQGLLPAS